MEIASGELGSVVGHEGAKRDWLDAVASGKLHHGWLFRGPRGIGKARLAIQFAARLLGAQSDPDFSETAEGRVGRLIAAGSHPDLRIIRRPVDDKGKEKSEIPVDSVRELAQFFSLRPAMGGWRVAIIDAVDELNRFGANAVLKTLEEPPSRAVLLLISHGEQAILPTVRSRCRVLRLAPLDQRDTIASLQMNGLHASRVESVASLAPGRPGRGLSLEGSDANAAVDAIRGALRGLGDMDSNVLHRALTLAAKTDVALAAAMESLRTSLQKRAARELDPVVAGDFASAALDVMRLDAEARALNQDKAQTVSAALSRIAELARR
jgi:DNA polymerase III subunit delta'